MGENEGALVQAKRTKRFLSTLRFPCLAFAQVFLCLLRLTFPKYFVATMSRQLSISSFFNKGNSNLITTPINSVIKDKPVLPEVKIGEKIERKGYHKHLKAHPDPLHESHENPRSGIHYLAINARVGEKLYRCKNTGNCKDRRGESIPDVTGQLNFVIKHSRNCWPNLKAVHLKSTTQYHKDNPDSNRAATKKYCQKNDEKLIAVKQSGSLPSIKCSLCSYMLYTQRELSTHMNTVHKDRGDYRNLRDFLSRVKWQGPWEEYEEGIDKNKHLKEGLKILTENRRISQVFHFAYLAIFLPFLIHDEESAWNYLEDNFENELTVIPFYAGKAGYHHDDFSVEAVHMKRLYSRIKEYINETGLRAFQLIALQQEDEPASAAQESVFQIMGEVAAARTTTRPNCFQFKIINLKAELTNWSKLPKGDFDLAIDMGTSQQPLLCLKKGCTRSHQIPGQMCFGNLHRNEVQLIPFEYSVSK